MDLIAQHQLDKASQIYYCVVKSVNNNQCTIIFNNKQYTVPYYGGKPTPNKTYAIFLPHNNMNESFVIGDGKDGGGGGSGSGIAIQPDPPTDSELVWIDTDDPGTIHIIPEIDDTQESASDTWSSQKIASEIRSLTAKTIYTPSVIKTSGNSSFYSGSAVECSGTCTLSLTFTNGTDTAAGGNSFVGTIAGVPLPYSESVGIGYYAVHIFGFAIRPDGTFTVRVLANPSGGYWATSDRHTVSLTYVVA